jgi:phospholipid-translocating ATPase
MSVIVRCLSTNEYLLLCKGAETSLFSICTDGLSIIDCEKSIDQFAVQGWRTMALGYKIITPKQMVDLEQRLKEIFNDISDKRNENLSFAYEEIETNLTLIGSTGVEDRLQEKVAQTLQSLRRAGIKIWVLTGDKKETAINISESCKHFSNSMHKLYLTDLNEMDILSERLKEHLN